MRAVDDVVDVDAVTAAPPPAAPASSTLSGSAAPKQPHPLLLHQKRPRTQCVEIPPDVKESVQKLKNIAQYGCKDGDTNGTWICPQCRESAKRWDRFVVHMVNHAKEFPEWMDVAMSLYPEQANKVAPTQAPLSATKRAASDTDSAQGLLTNYFKPSMEAQVKFRFALAQFFIGCNLPMTMVEHPEFVLFLKRAKEVFRSSKQDEDTLLLKRTAFTSVVDKAAREISDVARTEVEPLIRAFGASLTLDTRTNINGFPVVAMVLEGSFGLCPIGAVKTTPDAKDGRYYANLVKDVISETTGLGSHVVSVVMDGARANIVAMTLLEQECSLLWIRCQSHLFSLLVKDLFKVPGLVKLREGVEALYSWVRHNQRVFTRFMVLSNNKALMRPVDVRFATHVFALQRAVSLRPALVALLGDASYKAWVKSPAVKKKRKQAAREFERVVCDVAFWDAADFVLAIADPVVRALRLTDQEIVTPNAVARLWDSLGTRLLAVLKSPDNDDVDANIKKGVLEAYLNRADEASCDLLDAAWVLDPSNLCEVLRLAQSDNNDDLAAWALLVKAVRKVMQLLVRRTKRDEAESARLAAIATIDTEFDQYVTHSGIFKDVAVPTSNVDNVSAWWGAMHGSILAKYARRLLNVSVTISNDERLHKIFAAVQPPERTRLTHDRTNALVQAAYWLRAKRLPAKVVNTNVASFVEVEGLTSNVYDAYIAELDVAEASQQSVDGGVGVVDARTASSTSTATAAEDKGADEDADEDMESRSEGSSSDSEAEDERAAAAPAADAADASWEGSPQGSGRHFEVVDGAVVARTRRAVRITSRMREAAEELGLSTFGQ